MKLKKFIPLCFLFIGNLALPYPSLAEEKIEVIPLIQTSKGLSGKNFNYLDGKPELRLLKVKIPAGIETPIYTNPSPILFHVTRGRLKQVGGKKLISLKQEMHLWRVIMVALTMLKILERSPLYM